MSILGATEPGPPKAGQVYAIRCCCQPVKIFGYLRWPVNERWFVFTYTETAALEFGVPTGSASMEKARQETIQLRQIQLPGMLRYEWAVYSEDRPKEFWRRLPGFIEYTGEHDDKKRRSGLDNQPYVTKAAGHRPFGPARVRR